MANYILKQCLVLGLGGTLASGKNKVNLEIAALLTKILQNKKVAIMTGGPLSVLEKSIVSNLDLPTSAFRQLYLFPLNASAFYIYDKGWKEEYVLTLSFSEKEEILTALDQAVNKIRSLNSVNEIKGPRILEYSSQITLSALGLEASRSKKKDWDPTREKRMEIQNFLKGILPNFEVSIAGDTSINITAPGATKAYGIEQLERYAEVSKAGMIFIGDTLYEGGNDYPVLEIDVDVIQAGSPEEAISILNSFASQV